MPLVVDDLSELVSLLETHSEWQLPLARLLLSKKNVQDLLLQDPELRLVLRGLIIGEDLARLPSQVEDVKQIASRGLQIGEQALQVGQQALQVGQQALQAAQRAQQAAEQAQLTAEQAQQAAERAQQAAEQGLQRLDKVEADVMELKTTTARIEGRLRGEEGRRMGEEYSRRIRRIARQLFNGGEGGTPEEPEVEMRLAQWLAGRFDLTQRQKEMHNPVLADLVWWKGERVAVVEVSLKVNGEDIRRARLRADTLREVGVDSLPVVIGEEWATSDTRDLAEREGVAYKIGDEVSETLLEFRRATV